MPITIIFHITLVLFAGLIAGWICKKFNFSVLIGFLIIGTLIGPGGFDLTGSAERKKHKEESAFKSLINQKQLEVAQAKTLDKTISADEKVNFLEEKMKGLSKRIENQAQKEKILFEEASDELVLEVTAEFGVLLLLFAIGLEFSFDKLASMARYMFVGGVIQMLACIIPIALFCHFFELSWAAGAVVGSVIALSSTALVYKSMEEKDQANTKRGQAVLGVLLFQDVALVPLLLLIPMLFNNEIAETTMKYWGNSPWIDMPMKSLIFCGIVIAGKALITDVLVPQLIRLRANELVVLFAIVVLFGMCTVAVALSLTPALGALAAGLMLCENRLTHQIDALVLPLRETFSAVFFISLGMLMDFQFVFINPLLCLSALFGVIFFKWITSALALFICGMDRKSATWFGLCISQVGELAFMLLALVYSQKAISDNFYHTILFVSIASLVITPNMVSFALSKIPMINNLEGRNSLHPLVHRFLKSKREHAIIVGIGPIGASMANRLENMGHSVCLIDFNPINLLPFAQQGFATIAGDGASPEILEQAGIRKAKMVLVMVPVDSIALNVIKTSRQLNRSCVILSRARYQYNINDMKHAGAEMVFCEENNICESLLTMINQYSTL